eukprot:TRINITY_DN15613_c0_g2_i1.p1 TRINITY_DN15613_c0_g2~~TRINITY_DN15613_c0_g2_i1.p1  ORF type:complete len:248 (+),score=31.93 TRINITY_DN15613_c0_g2_i1:45-788(+)
MRYELQSGDCLLGRARVIERSQRRRVGVRCYSGAWIIAGAIVVLSGHARMFSLPGQVGRRKMVVASSSTALIAAPVSAGAEERNTGAGKPRIVGPKGEKPLYSFEIPAGFEDITDQVASALRQEGISDGGGRVKFERIKDGATISAGPLPTKTYAKTWRNELAGPGRGIKVLAFDQSPTEDALEFRKFAKRFKDAVGINGEHKWAKMLKGPNEGAMLLIEYPEDSVEKDDAMIQSVFASFRLEERGL